ncbi:hypothetical protein [Frigoribacterium sp. MEB024]|jgi:hypothetical protein|uniref:hypothetical protein n=1 Tax=Frigoribacterium sp. MEB024 TaxID=1589899 RepID=UPI0005BC1896|nr:hypothetical protein [Frigoribacterium sp. MEB024]
MTNTSRMSPRIEAWLKFIEGRESHPHRLDSFEVDSEYQKEFQAVYGICVQAIRYAGSYAVLYRLGRSREAVALARQALEYALTAQWAHFEATGPEQLIDSYHHTRNRTFRAVTEYLGTPREEVEEALRCMTTQGRKLPRVASMIEAIDYRGMFRTTYLQQSQIVHVTSETVTAFMDINGAGQFDLLSEADDPYPTQTVQYTAMATMFASWVLESLRVDTPGLAELDRLSDELTLPLNIRARKDEDTPSTEAAKDS